MATANKSGMNTGGSEVKREYHEGPKALEHFEHGMSKLFKASKDSVRDKPIPKLKKSVRKTQGDTSKG